MFSYFIFLLILFCSFLYLINMIRQFLVLYVLNNLFIFLLHFKFTFKPGIVNAIFIYFLDMGQNLLNISFYYTNSS